MELRICAHPLSQRVKAFCHAAPSFRCRCDFVDAASRHVIDIAIDRDVARHQGMFPDAPNVLDHLSLLSADRVPSDETGPLHSLHRDFGLDHCLPSKEPS